MEEKDTRIYLKKIRELDLEEPDIYEKLSSIFGYLKSVTPELYDGSKEQMVPAYRDVLNAVIDVYLRLPRTTIPLPNADRRSSYIFVDYLYEMVVEGLLLKKHPFHLLKEVDKNFYDGQMHPNYSRILVTFKKLSEV